MRDEVKNLRAELSRNPTGAFALGTVFPSVGFVRPLSTLTKGTNRFHVGKVGTFVFHCGAG